MRRDQIRPGHMIMTDHRCQTWFVIGTTRKNDEWTTYWMIIDEDHSTVTFEAYTSPGYHDCFPNHSFFDPNKP